MTSSDSYKLIADSLPTVPLNVVLDEGDPVGGGDGEREEGADWPHEEAHQDQQLITGLVLKGRQLIELFCLES